tara:strand:- start:42 stop:407 length:366 start_codon:yes stop_codon:yes gene_type:complete
MIKLTEEEKQERKKIACKKYRDKNKEKHNAYNKEYNKEYNKTYNGMKNNKISRWRSWGIKHDNFDDLFKLYYDTTNCADCNVELTRGTKNCNTTKCLDHDHTTGLFRDVICLSCNFSKKRL